MPFALTSAALPLCCVLYVVFTTLINLSLNSKVLVTPMKDSSLLGNVPSTDLCLESVCLEIAYTSHALRSVLYCSSKPNCIFFRVSL